MCSNIRTAGGRTTYCTVKLRPSEIETTHTFVLLAVYVRIRSHNAKYWQEIHTAFTLESIQ